MLRGQAFVCFAANADLPCACRATRKRTLTVKKRDFVFLQQIQNAVVVLLHHLVFALEHLTHIHAQAADLDAVIGKGMRCVIVVL